MESHKLNSLHDFIYKTCIKYNIDESHGLKHALGTVKWAEILMKAHTDISINEYNMIIYSAALHDMCDSKYRNIGEACEEIWHWLLKQGWTQDMSNTLINIITSMSYTKLKRKWVLGQPFAYPNHGIYQRAYHIVRHADLLEAYSVARCYIYSKYHMNWASEDEIWAETEYIMKERVFNYVNHGWLFLDSALAHVPALEAEAIRCIKERDKNYVF